MPQHIEPLSGGFVNARDPSLLEVGELQRADNLIYRPASPSPQQAPGSVLVSSSAGGAINGLRHCAFDNGLSLLVVQAAGAYKSTSAVSPGVFTSLVTQPAGKALEAIHYDGKHYLLNGVGPNQVLRRDGTVRRHGLAAVTGGVGVAAGPAGTWPLVDDSLPLFYDYWITEVYKNSVLGEDIESTFIGTPATIQVASATSTIVIQRPNTLNPEATHWRVYRSVGKKDAATVTFPFGFLVADVPMVDASGVSVYTFTDGGAVTTGPNFAGVGETPTGFYFYNSRGDLFNTFSAWDFPTRITADDASNATGTITTTPYMAALQAKTFGFTSIGSPITDINVTVEGLKTGVGLLAAYLSWDGGVTYTKSQNLGLSTILGTASTNGLWGRTWNGGELIDSLFRVVFVAYSAFQGSAGTVALDYAKVTVKHGGTTGAQTIIFPITEIIIGGTSFKDGAYGEPPAASFGDIFEDSLVTNDPDNKGSVRYSLETLPEACPPEYFLPLVTDKHDEVTCIKALGSVLIVGLNTYTARIDFFPRAEDSEFSRGRAWDTIQGSHGITGSKAACLFFIPQKGLYLAHVSRHGPMMTNGYQADTLTDDLNWSALVNTNELSGCEFENHPEEYRLLLYYAPAGATSNTKALAFYYHPTHLKNGKLKVSGPLDVVSNGSVLALLPSAEEILYTANNDMIYREGTGVGTPYVLRTRELHLGGPGVNGEITKVLLHQNGGGGYRVTPSVVMANVEPRTDTPIEIDAPSRGLARVPMRVGCGGIDFKVERLSGSGGGLDYLVLEYAGFGPENYPA